MNSTIQAPNGSYLPSSLKVLGHTTDGMVTVGFWSHVFGQHLTTLTVGDAAESASRHPREHTLAMADQVIRSYNNHVALVKALENLVRSVESGDYVATACDDARAVLASIK